MLTSLAHQDPSWIVIGITAGVAAGLALVWVLVSQKTRK